MINNGYATTAEFQTQSKKTVDGSAVNITNIENSIENASRFMDAYTYKFWYTKTLSSETFDIFSRSDEGVYTSNDQRSIYFPVPVISISAITDNGTALVENTGFWIYKNDGRIDRNGTWTSERRGIVVSGLIGYATVPDNIRLICLTIAQVISGLAVSVVINDDGTQDEILHRNIPKWVFDALNRERNIVI